MSDRGKAYAQAGVDLNAAAELVGGIKSIVKATHIKGVVSDIGGFGGLFKPDLTNIEEPVLVSSTDGVGTKLRLAFEWDRHDQIGIDLVAMCVNDVLVQGAPPLFFLDYFACGRLNSVPAKRVVAGVAEGCKIAGCALLGGETAEMPGSYPDGEYDLAGFCVGMADNAKIVDGSGVHDGDVLIGLASSGPHSNGYSLIRKIVAQEGLAGTDPFPGANQSTADVLAAPTRIYVREIKNLMRDFRLKGMVHITGGGFYENIPRVLPRGVVAQIDFQAWPKAEVFHWLKEKGGLSWPEMLQIFNCGVGYVLIVDRAAASEILDRLNNALKQPAWRIGEVRKRRPEETEQVDVLGAEA